ncbi:MAG TPA: BTAD domain-containing putative transcriptional regulator [Gaiellaceae bacterium]|nr:BTAD domain-containing putative transcriptional regulator [Gaiellaceae bacterium]
MPSNDPAAEPESRLREELENRIELRVLGPFELRVGGSPFQLAPMPERLLAAMALRAGEALSAETLIEAIWNGAPPASAPSVLRVYIAQLRRSLPPGRLVTERARYRLVVAEGELDAERFENLLVDGREALADTNDRLAESLFTRALELWRGQALVELNGEQFALEETARLEELRLQALEGRFEAGLRLGRHDELIPGLERLVAEFPLRERLRAHLMTALYRAGRQADALACYREGRAYLDAELGLEPGPELRELERRILVHDPALEGASLAPHSARRVVPPSTRLIGRDIELATLRELVLDSRTRLVSLVGLGGIGKTRLAIELAAELGERFADGALVVDLAPLSRAEQVVPAIARALGLREGEPGDWLETMAAELAGRELLVVLDNFEHVVEAAGELPPILTAAPRLTLLATSRSVLRLSAERVVELHPLDTDAARELLASRAAASGVDIDPEAPGFAEVCERLDGIPLAIELAAPWLRSRSPSDLVRLLDSRLDALPAGARDAPERHRTMRAAIDWSFELLDPAARHLFGRVTIFRNRFTLEAARAVEGTEDGDKALDALVAASIVRRFGSSYGLLEVVRGYGLELPSADAHGHDLHAAYFVRWAERAESELSGPEQGLWLEQLEAVHDDLRGALDWLGERGEAEARLRLAASLARFWYIRGHLSEGLERLAEAVDGAAAADPALVAKALRTASALAVLQGDYLRARTLAESALALYREVGDDTGIVRSLSNLGAILLGLGELERAAETLDECIEAAEALGEDRLIALARNNRGDVALSQGELEIAADQFEQSLALLRQANDVANVARSLYNLGAVEIERGRLELAQPLLLEALELSASVNDKEDMAWCLIALAAIGARTGKAEDASVVLGFADAFLNRIGAAIKPAEQLLYDRTLAGLRKALDDRELEGLLGAGRVLADAEALALAGSL